MTIGLESCVWPLRRLPEAVEALARVGGLEPTPCAIHPPNDATASDDAALGRWMERCGSSLGVEVEPAVERYERIDRLLLAAGPAILQVRSGASGGFISLLGAGRRGLRVLAPDLSIRRVRLAELHDALCNEVEGAVAPTLGRLLDQACTSAARRSSVRAAVLQAELAGIVIGGVWRLGLRAGADFRRQLRQDGLSRRLGLLVVAHAAQYLLWVLSWIMIGRGALEGRLDRGWLWAWGLLLVTLVPLRWLVTWWQGTVAIGAGGLLKRRLLHGMLGSAPESIRHQGVGQLLGRVLEAEAVESLALSGGALALTAGIELTVAVLVLGLSDGGKLHALLLALWIAGSVVGGIRYFRHRGRWTTARLDLTHDLVERMSGHRTRLAQEPPERWHDGEDQALEGYLRTSARLDTVTSGLWTLVPRGWLILGLIGLTPMFVYGHGPDSALAISLGGVLLGYRALERLTAGLTHLAGAAIAWRQVAPFFTAGAEDIQTGRAPPVKECEVVAPAPRGSEPLIDAHDLVFRHPGRLEPVLKGCDFQLRRGDRILLEGPSGGGKSTLASLLSGLRRPDGGLLLLGGLDRPTLGAATWRQRVAAAPQYHENHILTATLAFNLLMGRRWPPSAEDMLEAETVCRELGLGPLLDRMPAGLQQMVGESGWQLSQGERSRVFIGRALLQSADVVVLDESFAALDPENLAASLRCTVARAPTLVVIAHP